MGNDMYLFCLMLIGYFSGIAITLFLVKRELIRFVEARKDGK